MILFPLGNEIFADTGPDGISMFFVSCIVSQLVVIAVPRMVQSQLLHSFDDQFCVCGSHWDFFPGYFAVYLVPDGQVSVLLALKVSEMVCSPMCSGQARQKT